MFNGLRLIPVLYPLRSKNNSALTLSTMLHLSTLLETPPQPLPYPEGPQYRVSSCAEPCTTVCVQDFYIIPQSKEQVTVTLLKSTTCARGLRDFALTGPTSRQRILASNVACQNVHDHSRAWTALNTLGVKINWVQASPKLPHKSASLENKSQCFPYIDRFLYRVMHCAEACTVACAQDYRTNP